MILYGIPRDQLLVGASYLGETIDAEISDVLSKKVSKKGSTLIVSFTFVDSDIFFQEF